jgi:hypothetical protein
VSGTAYVSVVLEDTRDTVVFNGFEVRPRPWTWQDSISSDTAKIGQFDQCFKSQHGKVVGVACTTQRPDHLFSPSVDTLGFHLEPVLHGPNKGFWYVTSAFTAMHLRSQVRKDYRSDGDRFKVTGPDEVVDGCEAHFGSQVPDLINLDVNKLCMKTDTLAKMVQFIWAHEKKHLDSMIVHARKPVGDLHWNWEPLYSTDRAKLQFDIMREASTLHGEIVKAGLRSHQGDTVQFTSWLYRADVKEWRWHTLKLAN